MKSAPSEWGKPENIVLEYIREKVTMDRIEDVEEALSETASRYGPRSLLDFKQYFDGELMETVYRGIKGSYKIDASKFRGTAFLESILYILFGEPRIDQDRVQAEESEKRIKSVLKKRFERRSPFVRYSLRFLEAKTGKKFPKTYWINIEPYVYPLLGGEIFFYCTLRALMEVSKKALKDKKYNYLPVMNWKEGVVEYLASEAIGTKKFVKKFQKALDREKAK